MADFADLGPTTTAPKGSDFSDLGPKSTSKFDDLGPKKDPIPSARDQYVKAAGQLIAHATLVAKHASDPVGAEQPIIKGLNALGKQATEVTEKLDLPNPEESAKKAGYNADIVDIAASPLTHSRDIVDRLSKAAHETAIQFGIKPTQEEKIENPTIAALGITRPLRAYQTLIDKTLPEVTALEPWLALKEKPLTQKIDYVLNKANQESKLAESAIAPVETTKKEIPKFSLAMRAVLETNRQIGYGIAKGLESMLNPVDFLEAEAAGQAMGAAAGAAVKGGFEAVARTNPEAALRAQFSPLSKIAESDLAHLTKPTEDLTMMDHIHRHVQGTTNAVLEGIQEKTGASPSVMKAAADTLDRAGYEKVFRHLNGLGDLPYKVSVQTRQEPTADSSTRFLSYDARAVSEELHTRPLPVAPHDIAAQVGSAGVLNRDAAAVAKSYPSLYAVATGADLPKAATAQFNTVISELAKRGIPQGPALEMLKAGVATGKASFIQMSKLDQDIHSAALHEKGLGGHAIAIAAKDAQTAAEQPAETIVLHHMEQDAQKKAVLARAKATQDVWEEAHRVLAEEEKKWSMEDKSGPAPEGLPAHGGEGWENDRGAVPGEVFSWKGGTGPEDAPLALVENEPSGGSPTTYSAFANDVPVHNPNAAAQGIKDDQFLSVDEASKAAEAAGSAKPELPGRAEALAHAEAAGVPIEQAAELHRAEALKAQEAGTLDPGIAHEYAEAGDTSFDPAALEEQSQPFPNLAKHPADMTWEELQSEYPGIDKSVHKEIINEFKAKEVEASQKAHADSLKERGISAQPVLDYLRQNPISEKAIKALNLSGDFKNYKSLGIISKKSGSLVDNSLTGLREALRKKGLENILPENPTINDMLDLIDHESRKGTKSEAQASLVKDEPTGEGKPGEPSEPQAPAGKDYRQSESSALSQGGAQKSLGSSSDLSINRSITDVKTRADDWLNREAKARGMVNDDKFKLQFAAYVHKGVNDITGEMTREFLAVPDDKKQAWINAGGEDKYTLRAKELHDKFDSLLEAYPKIVKKIPHDPEGEAKVLEGFNPVQGGDSVVMDSPDQMNLFDENGDVNPLIDKDITRKEDWQMTRQEFVQGHLGKFVHQEGRRNIIGVMSQDGAVVYPIKDGDQKNGKLLRSPESILGDIHEWLVKSQHETYRRGQMPGALPMEKNAKPVPNDVLKEYGIGQTQSENKPIEAKQIGGGEASNKGPTDVGEELWYNRRNLIGKGIKWEDIKNLNATMKALEVQKTKVWPRPDYEELIQGGMQPFTAHLVKQVYDSISTKPNVSGTPTDAQMEAYVKEVAHIKDATFKWAKDAGAQKSMLEKMAAGAQARLQRGPVSISSLYSQGSDSLLDAVYPKAANGARWGRENMEQNERVNLVGGRKVADAMSMDLDHAVEAVKALGRGWPAPQEAWEKRFEIREVPAGTKQWSRDKGEHTTTAPYFEIKVRAQRGMMVRGEFATRDAAIAKAKELAETKKLTRRFAEVAVAEFKRVGPPQRPAGADVTPKDVQDKFGFRGINFGNYTDRGERQVFTNNAYDSLLDLADLLGIPAQAISLNGTLGLAYGAQGRGGKHAAHFVPGVNEINLTKDAGAGSLAHEWWHALDHYFAVQASEQLAKGTDPYLTHQIQSYGGAGKFAGIRPEIAKAFNDLVDAMKKRMQTPEEVAAANASYRAASVKRLDSWLKYFRDRIETHKPYTPYGEKPVPQTPKDAAIRANHLKQFDLLADALRRGQLGEGYEQIGRGKFSGVHQNVGEIRRLYKDVTGHVPSPDDIKSLDANASSLKFQDDATKQQDRMKAMAVGSDYLRGASGLETGGKGYWTKETELGARAFQSYVLDKLAAEERRNDYLTHPQGSTKDYEAAGGDPYPRGAEREKINAAFDTLVNSLKTKETEQGTMIYDDSASESAIAYRGQNLQEVSQAIQMDLDFSGQVQLPQKLARDGKVDYVGLEVNGLNDIAEIVASRRHPKMEHNNFVLVRRGRVVAHMVYTSGLPNAVLVTNEQKLEVLREAERLGADEIWTGHNHPSGDPKASYLDRTMDKDLRGRWGKFYKGMVITDGEEFYAVTPDDNSGYHKFKTPKENFVQGRGPSINDRSKAVAFAAKNAQMGKSHLVMFTDGLNRVISLESVEAKENLPGFVKQRIKEHGASGAVVVGPASEYKSSRDVVSLQRELPQEVLDAIFVDQDGQIKSPGGIETRSGGAVGGSGPSMFFSDIKSWRVAEEPPRYMGANGMDQSDFEAAIAEAKIQPGSQVTARVKMEGIAKGEKGQVVAIGKTSQTLLVKFPSEIVPLPVRAENLVETNRKPAARVALENAKKAAKVSGEPSMSIKKVIQEQQAGLFTEQADELELLSQKFKNQAKGARIGAREATKAVKAKMEARIDEFRQKVAGLKDDIKFTKAEAEANARWLAAEQDAIRSEIVGYLNATLPVEARGKFLATVKNADTVEKMLFARQAIDDAAAQIYKKGLLADIRKMVPRVLDSPRVDVKAKQAIREYLQDVELKGRSSATYSRLRKTLQFVVGQEASGVDIEMPRAVIEELDILGRRPLKEMGEAELEGIFLRLQMLEEIGRTSVKARESLYLMERERVSAEILADLKPIEGKEIKQQQGFKPLSTKDSALNKIKQAINSAYDKYLAITPPDVVWDMMAKTTQYQGSMVKHFSHGIGSDYARNIDIYDPAIKEAREVIEKHNLSDEQIARVTAHAHVRQPDGVPYLKNEALLSDADIKSVESIKGAEAELYAVWRKHLDGIYPQLADAVRFNDNIEVGFRPSFFPIRFDPNRAIESDDDLAKMIRGLHQGFQKNVQMKNIQRREGSDRAVALNGQRTFESYMRVAAYKVAMSRRVRMLGEIVNSPEFQQAAGDLGGRYAKQFVTMLARRGAPRASQTIPWIDNARRNASVFAIVGRLPTALVHMTLLSNAAAISGPGPIFGAFKDVLSEDATKSSRLEDWWRKNDPVYRQNHGDDPVFQDAADIAHWDSKEWWKALATPTSLRWIVRKATLATLEGNYKQALAKKGLGRDFDSAPNQDALNEAKLLTRRAIPSPELPHMFLAYNSGDVFTGNLSLNRAATQFKNFTIDRWSTYAHDLPEMIRSGRKADAARFAFWQTISDFVEVGVRHGYKLALAAALGAGAADEMDEDHRKFWGELFMKVLEKPPFVPDLINMAMYGRVPTTAGSLVYESATSAGAAVKAYNLAQNRKALQKMTESLVDMASLVVPIPFGGTIQQVMRMTMADGGVRFPYEDERTRLNNLHKDGRATQDELQRRVVLNHAYSHFEKLNANYRAALKDGRHEDASQILDSMKNIAHEAKP